MMKPLTLLLFPLLLSGQGIINTIAGSDPIYRGLPSNPLNAALGTLTSVSASGGTVYAVDTDQNIAFSISNGVLTVIAGTGVAGYSGDGGPATQAQLNQPSDIRAGSSGIYIADSGNGRIRRIVNGIITTYAGGFFGSPNNGDGGPPGRANLCYPTAIRLTSTGMFFTDCNRAVRQVANGIINTVAGSLFGMSGYGGDGGLATAAVFNGLTGIDFDPSTGYVYVSDEGNSRVRRFLVGGTITTYAGNGQSNPFGTNGDGGPATQAQIQKPEALWFDSFGNLFIADKSASAIRKVNPSGIISTVAGDGLLLGYSGDGGPATSATLTNPLGVAFDSNGNMYISGKGFIRMVNTSGTISILAGSGNYNFAGDGGPASAARFSSPFALAFDSGGNLFVADLGNNRIRKIDTSGNVTTFAGVGPPSISGGDGGPASSATLGLPTGLVFDSAGNLYFTEFTGMKIRKIAPNGTISTIAGTGAQGFSGDGGQATNATLNYPAYLRIDGQGNLYFVDIFNFRVRMVTPAGVISTVAGNGQMTTSGDGGPATSAGMFPFGLAVTSSGTLYIDDGKLVRQVVNGTITTLANVGHYGTGTGVIDASGNFLACFGDSQASFDEEDVIRATSAGVWSPIAGNGQPGFSGDGGPATSAQVECSGVALDGAGNVYIADGKDNRIRKVSAAAAAFSVLPTAVTFSVNQGINPTSQQIQVTGTAGGAVTATASTTTGGSWLSVSPGSGLVPATLLVSVNVQGLAPGTYQGSITIQSAGPALTVNATLTVSPAPAGQLTVAPTSLSVEGLPQSVANSSSSQTLTIGNTGGTTLSWTATTATANGGNWLSVSPPSGSATLALPSSVKVSFAVGNLPAGVYNGTITINPGALLVNVRAVITASGPTLVLGQTGLTFTGVAGGGALAAQSVNVVNSGTGGLNWTTSVVSGASWLSVSPPSGSSNSGGGAVPLQAAANVSGLAAGAYYGLVQVSAGGVPNTPQYITVVLNVAPAATHPPVMIYPQAIIVTAPAGGGGNGASIQLSTGSNTAVPYSISVNGVSGGNVWLSASAQGSSLNPANSVNFSVTSSGLAVGGYAGVISFLFADGSPSQDAQVLFIVTPSSTVQAQRDAPAATCSASKLYMVMRQLANNFSSPVGWPVNLEAQLFDDCGNPATSATVLATFSSGDAPLTLANVGQGIYSATWKPATSSTSATIVTVRGIQGGLTPATLTVSGQAAVNPTPPPAVGSGGVVNGASFAKNAEVAPGGIVSVFGLNLANSDGNLAVSFPLPTSLAGIKLTIGGVDAPLFYAGTTQVNAQIPVEVAVNSTVQVVARAISGSVESDAVPEPITVGAAHPGIFTIPGSTQGAILNIANLVVNSANPATATDTVVVYCTGLGATNPPQATGQGPAVQANAVIQPTVTVGGVTAVVSYAGITPTYVGLYQVNVVIPVGVLTGPAVPVVITQNSVTSNIATIAIH